MKDIKEIIAEWEKLLHDAPFTHTYEPDDFKPGMKAVAEYFLNKEEKGLFNPDELYLHGLVFAYGNVDFDYTSKFYSPEDIDRIVLFGASANAAFDLAEIIRTSDFDRLKDNKMKGSYHYHNTDFDLQMNYDFESADLSDYFDEIMAARDNIYKTYAKIKKMIEQGD